MASCSGIYANSEKPVMESVTIFKYYDNETEPHSGENMHWKCKLCGRFISSSKRATSNLITHVQRKHPCEYAVYQKEKEWTKIFGENRVRLNAVPMALNTCTAGFKYCETDLQQIRLNDALVQLVADNLLPFSFVESSGFQRFMGVVDPRYRTPSEKHFSMTMVPNRQKYIENILKDSVKDCKQICVSFDAWEDHHASCSYLAAVGHYVDNWNMKSALLSCRVYDRSVNTCENLVQQFEKVVDLFDIRDKVRHVVTDSALIAARAADVFTVVKDEDSEEDTAGLDACPVVVTASEILQRLPEHMTCFLCALHSVVKSIFRVCPAVLGILNEVFRFVDFLKMALIESDVLNVYLPAISLATSSSWNTRLKLARSFLKIPESVLGSNCSVRNGTSAAAATMTVEDRLVLQEFLDVMEPFEEAVDQLQGQQIVTVSNVLPCIKGLKLSLKSVKVKYCGELVEHLSNCVEQRLSSYENCKAYILGAVVDPRFKMDWCSPDEVLNFQTLLFDEMKGAVTRDQSLLDGAHNTSGESSPEDLSNSFKRPKLFGYMSENVTTTFRDVEERIAQEIAHYLASQCVPHSCDPLAWWKCHVLEFPILAVVAKNFLSICASSTAIDRIISRESFVVPRRNIPSDDFESLMLIKCNPQFVF